MQLIMLTPLAAKGYFDAITLDSCSSEFSFDVKRLIDAIVADLSGFGLSGPGASVTNYIQFVYMMLCLHCSVYVKATSPDSAVDKDYLAALLPKLHNLAPTITGNDILVADKMDILYGTNQLTNSEMNKFTVWFYEHSYEIAVNLINPSRIEEVYAEAVRYLETVISNIEQNVIFLGQEINPDDVVVLCLYPVMGNLYFVVD